MGAEGARREKRLGGERWGAGTGRDIEPRRMDEVTRARRMPSSRGLGRHTCLPRSWPDLRARRQGFSPVSDGETGRVQHEGAGP